MCSLCNEKRKEKVRKMERIETALRGPPAGSTRQSHTKEQRPAEVEERDHHFRPRLPHNHAVIFTQSFISPLRVLFLFSSSNSSDFVLGPHTLARSSIYFVLPFSLAKVMIASQPCTKRLLLDSALRDKFHITSFTGSVLLSVRSHAAAHLF